MEPVKDRIRAGRLSEERPEEVAAFLSSMAADRWIGEADLMVNIAHLLMLREKGLVKEEHARAVMAVLLEMVEGGIPEEAFDEQYEDIHAGIEAYLIARTGEESGGRLHTGRSRNDQVATCMRIRAREGLIACMQELVAFRDVLLDLAAVHQTTVMPGFTHLQHAQPTTLAHHLLAHEAAFSRDFDRMRTVFGRINHSPLGAAAFASTGLPVDRELTARLLGFAGVEGNTMDAVSARDGLLEIVSACSILMAHASRCCEELVLWSTRPFRFVELSDAYCSTSSIMPQKKNPDTAEIMRAKAGTVNGALIAALTCLKALPMSYNRDLQEMTPHLWHALDTTRRSVHLLSGMYAGAEFDRRRMREEAGRGYSTATDLADRLVLEFGLPFRKAHNIVGRAVRKGGINLVTMEQAALEVAGISLVSMGLTEERITQALDPETAVGQRAGIGGPAPVAVQAAVKERRRLNRRDTAWLEKISDGMEESRRLLLARAREVIA